jgi:hypothetical protein
MITRRAFFQRLVGGFAAVVVGPTIVKALPAPPLGISMRFIRSFTVETGTSVTRFDVFYGMATVRPDLACRVVE